MLETLNERYTKMFERKAPIATIDKAKIEDTSPPGFYDGYFIVRNIGGGNLEGDIFSQSSFITFSSQQIEGNDIIIEFEIDLSHLLPDDCFTSQIIFTTSGGQLVIPIKIQIEQYSIKCGRFKIHTLEDFCSCVRAIPEDAARIFPTAEFRQWLINSKCSHMEFYNEITKSDITLKKMETFLTVIGLKDRATISPVNKKIEVLLSLEKEKTKEKIVLSRISWGSFEYDVRTMNGSKWLLLPKKKISSEDFLDDETEFEIVIDQSMIHASKSYESVIFENGREQIVVPVIAIRPKLFNVKLSRNSYNSEDSGYLIVENHTGKNVLLEVSSSENFVRFKAAKYFIEESTEIPFEIKVNSFLNLGIGKKPVNISNINLRAVVDDKVFRQTIVIKAGSLLL